MKVPLAGGPVTALASMNGAAGLVLAGGRVYWVSNGPAAPDPANPPGVFSVSESGGPVATLSLNGVNNAGFLTTDLTNLYWSNSGPPEASQQWDQGSIVGMLLNGGPLTYYAKPAYQPYWIAFAASNIYWTEAGNFLWMPGRVLAAPK